MQIFTLFEAQMRAFHSGHATVADLTIGFQSRLLPATAGIGETCDYVFLRAGEAQPQFVAERPEWWACLRGGLRLSAPGRGSLLAGGGELFAPATGMPMQVRAMVDTILVRAVAQGAEAAPVSLPAGARRCALGRMGADEPEGMAAVAAVGGAALLQDCSGMRPEFIQLDASGGDWAQRLRARGLRWALCYRGAAGLYWHGPEAPAADDEAFLQPGALYAPDANETCRLDVLMPGTGLLCCFGPPGELGDRGEEDEGGTGQAFRCAGRLAGERAATPALVAA
ncbi:hypothetical protein Tamer19_27120 [Cupriavidus sp. TA19]|uniref:hypothetical protein n=1 Tax=unclassified Cupriavidus TaxID=2640874 RepID=UPI000E2F66E3|nr:MULTISPECIES: hypothetical protein [unclassified Cupriavidus]BDB23627.1 hypothetical protein CTP10_R09630 [Cupriavidus sp. P-10]GLC93304.1 hypothetical protein Tamer19_27120 [Cupriavidus sp. TA19]